MIAALVLLLFTGVAWGQQQQCVAERTALSIRDSNRDWCEVELGRAIAERDKARAELAKLEAEKEKAEKEKAEKEKAEKEGGE